MMVTANSGDISINPSDPTSLPAHVLSSHITARCLSPVDVVEALLEKIHNSDPKLHAFIEVYASEAHSAAEAAHKAIRSGHSVGPLHGIPVALKDLIEIEGHITTGGSMIWRHRRSNCTATLARRLIQQGMIIIGKTHTTEFALGAWGINQRMGTPRNPWDAQAHRASGGSSSGSGVAVAARMVPWAVGTDTGGSVRIPAAWCGVVGLKATRGKISTHGVLSLSPSLDSVGPIARSVEDAALLYNAMQGHDPLDPLTLGAPTNNPQAALKRGVAGLRLGRLPQEVLLGTVAEVESAYENAIEALAKLGAVIVTSKWPDCFVHNDAISTIVMAEAHALYGSLAKNTALPLDDGTRDELCSASTISTTNYLNALWDQKRLQSEFAAVFEHIDALLTPTVQVAAPAVNQIDRRNPPTKFTRFVNFSNLCALALPNGFTANGLPTSLQIVGRAFSEAMVLRIGWAYQNATDWHERAPPMRVSDRPARTDTHTLANHAERMF